VPLLQALPLLLALAALPLALAQALLEATALPPELALLLTLPEKLELGE